MAEVNIIFNGEAMKADDSQTILEFAKSQGIEIPTLCYDNRLDPYGSCFVCVCEVKGARTLIPSCATKLREGMEIQTNSEKVMNSRKTALELILSNHYGDCIAPCKAECPAHCDIQGYVGLVANKKYDDAIRLIKKTIPMPASIGRVCTKFCEKKCRRQNIDESIAIDSIKRFAADKDLFSDKPYIPACKAKIGKKVAVIGGGPAGLAAAYYLAQEGVDVEIFDAKDKLGGMLRYGIPEYRLPKAILDKEIETILALGIKVNYNKVLNKDFTIDSLRKNGFDAIVVACGAWSAAKLGIPNEEGAVNVLDGIKFLGEVAEGKAPKLHGRVAIVGGGNTAFDCARTAMRLGADEVEMVYRRTRDAMPANEIEKIEAEEEGVKFKLLTAPVSVVRDGDKATGMIVQKMELGEPDASGRRSPVPVAGSDYEEKYDFIIAAIGQKPDFNILGSDKATLLGDNRLIPYNKLTGQTGVKDVFVAGDYASGAKTVVEGLAGGKAAAVAITKYFAGEELEPVPEFLCKREDLKPLDEKFFSQWEKADRAKPVVMKPADRKRVFTEMESTFDEETAIREAKRCMECGCVDVYECSLKKYAQAYKAKDNKYKGAVNQYQFDNSSKYLFREPSKCVLCGRCARLCADVVGLGVYGYVKRGFNSVLMPKFSHPLGTTECISCGTCISGCPVGAIVPKLPAAKKAPLCGKITDSYCYHCSIGCENQVELLEDSILQVHEVDKALCKKGRFLIPNVDTKKYGIADFESLKNVKDATVFASASLTAEDYEGLKAIAAKQGWNLINYYSQSTLWQAFASLKTLPSMDFFNREIGSNAAVIVAGDFDHINPIALNRLHAIYKEDTQIFCLTKDLTKRMYRMGAKAIADIKELDKLGLEKFSEVILLINPISVDQTFGDNTALSLYNLAASKTNALHTTLFSESRNLYSAADADKLADVKGQKLYIQTKAADTNAQNSITLPYSFQMAGTFLNSKNEMYKNKPLFKNDDVTIAAIADKVFGAKAAAVQTIKNETAEKPLNYSGKGISFPDDMFITTYSRQD